MPEIAEVHLNSDLILKPNLLGQSLKQIDILSGKYANKKPPHFNQFVSQLPSKIVNIGNRGKFIWLELSNGWNVGIGFGMTGRFTLDDERNHNRIRLENDQGDEIYYNDMRNFGNWYFWNGRTELNKKLKTLGLDFLLQPKATRKEINDLFKTRKKFLNWDISKALMSQEILAGVGNYLRAEGLYQTKIYPYAKVKDLSDQVLHQLYKNLVKIAQQAYRIQKSNFLENAPYEDFQQYMKIYNKKHDPDGNPVTRTAGTRTTWWVKSVQTIGTEK